MKLLMGGSVIALMLAVSTGLAQVIVDPDYRPPETVQRVVIPVDPTEKRPKVLIISCWNSYEHDWTGLLARQFERLATIEAQCVGDGLLGFHRTRPGGGPRVCQAWPE